MCVSQFYCAHAAIDGPKQTYGRVMVDPIAFRLFEPNCTYNLTVHKRLDKNMLEEEQYIIARPIMLGFCFGVKKWGLFVY